MYISYHKIDFMQWRTTHLYYLLRIFIIYWNIILPFILLKFISWWTWFRFQCDIFKYCHQMAYITFSFDIIILDLLILWFWHFIFFYVNSSIDYQNISSASFHLGCRQITRLLFCIPLICYILYCLIYYSKINLLCHFL